jgi:hypothetical protein
MAGSRRLTDVAHYSGLLFCVIPEPPGTLNDDNAERWG